MHALAQQALSQQDVFRYLVWIGLAIALLVVGGAGVMLYRKKMFQAESQVDAAGSIFDDLRRAHRDGLLSQEEYDLARKKLATRAAQAMDRRAAERAAEKKKADKYGPGRSRGSYGGE